MAAAPVAAAFAHYLGMAGQLTIAQTVVTDDSSIPVVQHAHCQTAKSHPASCSFHVCVDCAITSSFGFFLVHSSGHYSNVEKPTYLSLFVSPEIKPPIVSL
jgi:hypothetical protein